MAQPVWVLSVDLQTKSAAFKSGMSEAAKSARTAFTDVQSGAASMAEGTSEGFLNVRASLGILDNSIRGNHAAAMADLIRLFAQSSVVMSALPIAATAGGILLLGGVVLAAAKEIQAFREAQEKLKDETTDFGTAIQTVFNGLDEKLLQAGIRSDELRNDHLGALRNELKLIDMQSMAELVRSFGEIDKAADALFGDLKSHWYTFGIGSSGASHALSQFKSQYDSLLAQGKDSQAGDLLKGTLGSAQRVLALQKEAAANKPSGGIDSDEKWAEAMKYHAAINELKKDGVGYTEKEVAAQQALVDALNAQAGVEAKVHALTQAQKGNATQSTGNEFAAQRAAAAREAADHTSKMGELALAAEKEQASVAQSIQRGSIADRLASDMAFAEQQYELQLQSNQNLQNALDKGGKDYNNQLKTLQDQAAEITLQYANTVASLRGKATGEQYQKDIADMEEGEREKIDATQQGSAARLAAIDAAIKQEQAKNLQTTQHYRDLLAQQVHAAREAAEQEAKAKEEAGTQHAGSGLKTGELAIAAMKDQQALENSLRHVSAEARMQQDIQVANAEYALKLTFFSQEIAALDKNGKDYNNKLKELQSQELLLTQQHESQLTSIKQKAATEQNQQAQSAMTQFETLMASGFTQVLMGHKTFASMMNSIGNQVVSGMIQNALMSMMTADMDKEKQAARAARYMFNAGAEMPFPANIVMAPVLGAAAFASVMAFQEGGIVPGVGRGDIVPAMLEPGEAVIPKGVVEGLSNRTSSGSTSAPVHAVHLHMTNHFQALDSDGMSHVLKKHADQIQKHVRSELRRMNK